MKTKTKTKLKKWLTRAYNEAENSVEQGVIIKIAYELNIKLIDEEVVLFETFAEMFRT